MKKKIEIIPILNVDFFYFTLDKVAIEVAWKCIGEQNTDESFMRSQVSARLKSSSVGVRNSN